MYVDEIFIIKNEENKFVDMFNISENLFEDYASKPAFPRFTLDNPILPYNREFMCNLLSKKSESAPTYLIKEFQSVVDPLCKFSSNLTLSKKSEFLYSHLFSPTLLFDYEYDIESRNDSAIEDCIRRFLISLKNHENFPEWARVDDSEILRVTQASQDVRIKGMIYWNEQMSSLRNGMATLQSLQSHQHSSCVLKHPTGDLHFLYTANIAFLLIPEIGPCLEHTERRTLTYLFDYDQICGIVDTSVGRTLTLEASILHQSFNIKNMPRFDTISALYRWGDRQLAQLGNDGYLVLKTFESIIRTLVLRNEPYDYCRSFHHKCLNGLSDIFETLGLGGANCPSYLELLQILDQISDIESSEIAGVYRHWMHPTVDEQAGMKKIKNISSKRKPISHRLIQRTRAAFNRAFILEYITQHRKWPPVKIVGKLGGPLQRWVEKKMLIFDESAQNYNWEDWGNISFGKTFEFDFKVDTMDLLDDKACSLPKNRCHQIFYKKYSKEDWCDSREQRRVLIDILSREEFDTKSIIQKIIHRDIPDEWKVVGLHSKEREMKLEPRMFAILPIEIRAYFMLTEYNIAKSLFKYFPQQTMNLNADQLDRRLLQLSAPKHPKDQAKKKFTANLDFKSWNIHWTKEAVESIFVQIGCLFGMPTLYTFTHEFFEMAMHFLSSFCSPPECWKGGSFSSDQACDCHLWFGHHGGLEGLRQKGWTLVTIAMLELVRIETDIESIITGQGDNQVIVFFIRELLAKGMTPRQIEEYYTTAIELYIKTIEQISRGMGHELKIEETWVSTRIFEYGKDLLIDGVFVSSIYKRVSRALEVTNELAPGLQSQVSHVFSVMQAGCAKGFSWLPLYVQSLSISSRVLKNHLVFDQANPSRGRITLNDKKYMILLQLLLFVPRALGGLACLPFTEFVLRGHPDPVTSGLVHLRMLENQIDIIPPYVTALLDGDFFAKETDFLMLATAPDALNLDNVRTEQNIWKSLVKRGSRSFVKNSLFKEVLNLATDEGERELINWMREITPVFPRFMSIIYSATVYGAVAKVIGRFGNNKTLVYASGATDVKKSTRLIRNSHSKQFNNLLEVSEHLKTKKSTLLSDLCLTDLAQKLRDRSWKLEDTEHGVYGSTVPHPFEQVSIQTNNGDDCYPGEPCLEKPYIFFQVLKSESDSPRHLIRGDSEPYLSGRIRPKREQGIVHTTILDSPIIAAAQLASNRTSVCDPGTNMDQTILNIVRSRTNIPIEIVESLIGRVYGGTLWHRLPDQFTSHEISLNCRPNVTTHVYISTDMMAKYARGVRDYTLPYQSIFVAVNSLLSDASARGKLPQETIVLHVHLCCVSCTREIEPIKIESLSIYDDLSFISTNPLIKSTTTTLPLSSRDLIRPPSGLVDKRTQTTHHRVCAISHLIAHRFHTNVQVAMRGLIPMRRFKTDIQLRLGDILSVNPSNIIKHLALHLIVSVPNLFSQYQYATLSSMRNSLVIFINMSGHHLWDNIGSFATLPEFVSALYNSWPLEDAGMDYGKGGAHTYRFLNRLLIQCLNNILKNSTVYKKIKTLRLYSSDPNWTSVLYTSQHMIITLWLMSKDIFQGKYQKIIAMPHVPTEESVTERVTECLKDVELVNVCQVLQNFSPLLRNSTPEADARCNEQMLNLPTYHKFGSLSPTMPCSLRIELKKDIIDCTFGNLPLLIPNIPSNPRVTLKSRKDHEFKLIGNSSTAMYKWICVLYHMNIKGSTCMTLGEGAGGLARCLLELFHCDSIVFNTLINAQEFDPHRVTSYVPSELKNWESRIFELQYCREHGGDLLENKTVTNYSRWRNIQVVTCDAEVGTDDVSNRLKLVTNVALIAFSCLSDTGSLFLKSFCQNINVLIQELTILSKFFQRIRVFYTIESSFENYEVFIEASEKGHLKEFKSLTMDTITKIQLMSQQRLSHQPFQLTYPQQHEEVVNLLSFRSPNLIYSLRVFSNNLLEPHQWTEKDISGYQRCIEDLADQRIRTHKNLIFTQVSHTANPSLVGAIASEERFLYLMSTWYINLEILKGLLVYKNSSPWEYRFKSYHPCSAYFLIPQQDLEEYEQRFARHFYHLLGHAKRM